VSNVVTAQSAAHKENDMTIFTIDELNNITAFASQDEASAASTTPFDSFGSEQQLAELVAAWPAARLVALWNGLPGVTPVKSLKSPQAATARIWKRIQGLGETQPTVERKAHVGVTSRKSAPAKRKAARKRTAVRPAPRGRKAAPAPDPVALRKGTKTAQVVAMLQRKNGATLAEIVQKMGWQKHTVRGFMAGAMKKAGYHVESFKPEGGARTYRLKP
jgi:hypothetical protein